MTASLAPATDTYSPAAALLPLQPDSSLAVEVMRKAGVFIADGVQPGFGRLGTHMWASRATSCLPDIVTVSKLMGDDHLGDRGTIAAGGDRGVRQAHLLFQHLWRQPGILRRGPRGSEGHQGRPAVGADQRAGNEGRILKILAAGILVEGC